MGGSHVRSFKGILTRMQAWAVSRRLAGETHKQAAERIGVTEQAMKQRINRANKRARARLGKEQREAYFKAIARPARKTKIKPLSLSFGA